MSTATKKTASKAPKAKAKKAPVAKKSPFPKKIGLYILYVPDMKKAVDFYKSKLGLELGYESPEWTQFSAGIDFALHISEQGCGGSCGSTSEATTEKGIETGLVFNVEDTKATYAAFQAVGIKVRGEPVNVCESTRCFSFEDPFGNVLSVSGK